MKVDETCANYCGDGEIHKCYIYGTITSGCDDCISRQAVLDGLASIAKVKARSDAQKSLMGRIMFFVEQLPPVAPKEKTGWIPVSERLPEELEPVNITWINHNPESYYANIKDKPFTATGIYFNGQWYWWSTLCTDILAEVWR